MSKAFHFEKSMAALETIVNHLEKGDLTLDDALKEFEQGIALARECQAVLTAAEQKIQTLVQNITDNQHD